ncbi:MAG: pectate lyase, partial [Bacteroidales bacterium]
MKKTTFTFILCMACTAAFPQYPGRAAQPSVKSNQSGTLEYTQDAQANCIPDYSYCGYMASELPIPELPVKAVVSWLPGDNTARIQEAIDYVSSLEPDAQGFRGAVLLEKGSYEIAGGLTISASGVVLRGSGYMEGQTELLGSGTDRTTMIRLAGKKDYKTGEYTGISSYAPTGTMAIVVPGHSFKTGQSVRIMRPGTQEWIDAMDMNDFGGESSYIGWKPEDMFIYWERRVKEVRGDSILLDAPMSSALDPDYGGGFVCSFDWPGRISRSGVENLRLRSTYDSHNPKDENHRWIAINLDNIQDAWVRRVEFRHFAGSAVFLTENTRRITVEDCKSIEPVSEIGGQRRQSFFTLGGQGLFQRLYSEYGFHDFAVGRCAPGPNAFVQCYAWMPFNFSGTVDSWSTGVLFDVVNVEGHGIYFSNRGQDGLGAGWTTGNSMMWNCSASMLACPLPPTAYNWSYGAWGQRSGNVAWNSAGSFVKPHS